MDKTLAEKLDGLLQSHTYGMRLDILFPFLLAEEGKVTVLAVTGDPSGLRYTVQVARGTITFLEHHQYIYDVMVNGETL